MVAHEHRDIPSCWNAYVASGETRAARKARLGECPETFRADVERHVRTFFAIRSAAARRARGAA